MKLSVFFLLLAVATAVRKDHQRFRDFKGRKHVRRTQWTYYWSYVQIFTDKKEFEEALSYYRLNYTMDNTFSSFLDGETSKELDVGENDVGILQINIKNENITDGGGVIEKGEDGVESYSYTYEKDETEIEFERSDGGKMYAFAAEWDINQEWEDFYDDVYKNALQENIGNQKDVGDDDYYWYNNMWVDYEQDNDYEQDDYWDNYWNNYNAKQDQMLHAKVGTSKYNLLYHMYYHQTNFIGFFDPDGFLSAKLFTPEKSDSPINFRMSRVMVSDGEPRCPPPFPVTMMLRLIEFLDSIAFGGLIEFLEQFRNALPFP